MSDRKRVNISIDPATYAKLQQLRQAYGFANVCEVVVAIVHILIDRVERADKRRYDLPEDDGRYIDEMFAELAHHQPEPDGTVPVRHHYKQPK